MKSIVLALAMSLSDVAVEKDATLCFAAASVGQAVAELRDHHIPREGVELLVQLMFNAQMHQPSLTRLVDAVYQSTQLSKEHIYTRVLNSCTSEMLIL